LIVVIVILSLAVAVAYPKLSGGFLASERLRSSVSALAAVASYARDQAVATRRTQVLSLDLASGAYSVASASPPAPDTESPAAPELPPSPSGPASPAALQWPPNPSGQESPAAPVSGEDAAPAASSGVVGALAEGVAFGSVRLAGKTVPPGTLANLRFTPEGWADPAVIQIRGPGGEIHSVVITAPAGRIETYPSAVSEDESAVAD